MNRRSFLSSILAAGVAPWVMSNGIAGGVLMPVRKILTSDVYVGRWMPLALVAEVIDGPLVLVDLGGAQEIWVPSTQPLSVALDDPQRYLLIGRHVYEGVP